MYPLHGRGEGGEYPVGRTISPKANFNAKEWSLLPVLCLLQNAGKKRMPRVPETQEGANGADEKRGKSRNQGGQHGTAGA